MPSDSNSMFSPISTSPPPPSAAGAPTSTTNGVSNCYVFKSRLQEYAQKVSIPTPEYETIKEGPSHEPAFRSTVTVDGIRYDSLPGFFNRKAAEQSAAEVALMEIAKSGNINDCIYQPVHETGLCKNLLQEYAQKMNYAIPSYTIHEVEKLGRDGHFSCTIDIGGIHYIGAAAKTKKEAAIKAARTALLAIQSTPNGLAYRPASRAHLTVLPLRRKGSDPIPKSEPTPKALKPKKTRYKRRYLKKCFHENVGNLESNTEIQVPTRSELEKTNEEISDLQASLAPQFTERISNPSDFEDSKVEVSAAMFSEVNKVVGICSIEPVDSMMSDHKLSEVETLSRAPESNQTADDVTSNV